MKLAVVLFTTERDNPGLALLRETLAHYRWPDPLVLESGSGWQGHPYKLKTVYKALPALKEAGFTHALYSDCWDVICCGSISPVLRFINDPLSPKLLLSGDAGHWSDGVVTEVDFDRIHGHPYRWRYINGGGWVGEIDFLLEYFADHHTEHVNDQWYLSRKYLANREHVAIDNSCEIFQCLSRTDPSLFVAEHGVIYNRETGTCPVLIHGAGGTVMDWVPVVNQKWAQLVRNY